MKKVALVVLFFTFFLASSAAAITYCINAGATTSLFVVRGGNNNLYKKTCSGTCCTGWSQINGQFAQQPTLFWSEWRDEYVLIGVSAQNVIWESTFNRDGSFNNDWTALSGSSPSPVAASSASLTNISATNGGNAKVAFGSGQTKTMNEITINAPANGYFLVRSTGELDDASDAVNCVALSTKTSFDISTEDYSCSTNIGSSTNGDIFAIESYFPATTAGNYTFYALAHNVNLVNGNTAKNANISATYFPYAY